MIDNPEIWFQVKSKKSENEIKIISFQELLENPIEAKIESNYFSYEGEMASFYAHGMGSLEINQKGINLKKEHLPEIFGILKFNCNRYSSQKLNLTKIILKGYFNKSVLYGEGQEIIIIDDQKYCSTKGIFKNGILDKGSVFNHLNGHTSVSYSYETIKGNKQIREITYKNDNGTTVIEKIDDFLSPKSFDLKGKTNLSFEIEASHGIPYLVSTVSGFNEPENLTDPFPLDWNKLKSLTFKGVFTSS